jgi:hypothetical protein
MAYPFCGRENGSFAVNSTVEVSYGIDRARGERPFNEHERDLLLLIPSISAGSTAGWRCRWVSAKHVRRCRRGDASSCAFFLPVAAKSRLPMTFS